MFHKLIFLFLFLVFTLPVFGQGFFISRYYSAKEYNSNQQIWDVEVDSNQYVIFGTGEGVSTYDGIKWNNFHIGESGRGTSLLNSTLGSFFLSGQYDYGIMDLDLFNSPIYSSISNAYYAPSEKFNEHFSTIELDGKIYFFGFQGLEKLQEDSITKYALEGINSASAFKFQERIFVSTKNGFYEFIEDSFHFLEESKVFDGFRNMFAIPISNEKVLLGFAENGLFYFDGTTFSKFANEAEDYIKESYLYDGIQINDSTFAFATLDGGVIILDDSGIINFVHNEYNEFPKKGILDLHIDHEKTLWMGLYGGIEKVNINTPLLKFSSNGGIIYEVLDIKVLNGEVFIRSLQELQKSIVLPYKKTLKFESIDKALYVDGISRIGEFKNQLLLSNTSGVFRYSEENGLEQIHKHPALSFLDDYDDTDTFSFLTHENIITSDLNSFIKKGIKNPVLDISQGLIKDSEVYLKGENSIYFLNEDSLQEIPTENDTTVKTIYNKIGVIDNEIYVAAQGANKNGGLYKLNRNRWKFEKANFFGELDKELVTHQILEFTQCKNGDIWFQNNKQIKRVSKAGNERKVQASPYQMIGEYDAIYSIECGENNDVWFGGINGLYHLKNPDWEYKTNFKTNITGIYVNNDSLIYGGFGEPVKDIVLPYKDNELRFTYAAASYIDSEKNTYSVKLDGFDDNWSDWSLETQKDYTNIPEGNYEFRVRSKNVYKVDGKEDIIYFSVLPPWYRTWWAYLIYLILISSFLYTAFRIRVNQILKVERMRSKIAGDLHDEVSATLTGISYFAEAIKRDPDQSKKDYFVSLITESADDAKEKITDIVWSINPDNDNWELFLSKCRRYASDLLESKGIDYELKITEHIPGKFNMEVRQQLWMIFKEILTNSVRHSEAKRLDVIMDVDGKNLKLIIQDDGKGFDLKTIDYGNGIESIKSRASSINAFIDVNTSPEFGTRWRMVLPL